MSQLIEVKVPDIGDFKDVPIIEVLVKAGDRVKKEDSLITLESDKATMEVPSPHDGVVKEVDVKVGDKVAEGRLILVLEAGGAPAAAQAPAAAPPSPPASFGTAQDRPVPQGERGGSSAVSTSVDVRVPDIGDFKDVPIIELFVKPGDTVKKDDSLVTLESDKATMEVPSTHGGVVKAVHVKLGDKVSEGGLIVTLEAAAGARPAAAPDAAPSQPAAAAAPAAPAPAAASPAAAPVPPAKVDEAGFAKAHASPAIRRFARELGVDLSRVKGSGPKGRITREDVQGFVKAALAQGPAAAAPSGGGLNLLPWPDVDFAKFGPVETRPLSRIKKISGANLARNWVMIPHVTHHDEADITDLEAFRKQSGEAVAKQGIKVTMLAFLIKASVAALRKFPDFNASLDKAGENLVLKGYYHIGFAADTPNGLVVPVLKDADRKGVLAIAKEMGDLSALAREGKLKPTDMQGASFTISSLGGIGGTSFTPIINAPEVAILGVCRSQTRPVWDGKQFQPRLMLPLSLSYDHRVIDGAAAARFTAYLASVLADMRRVLL
ncbi:MAG TPA: dihydrolipoyllysine-residue acetyltransferase [Burkholderiales bacterium]|nr:dihydrolipoyllysine-residue acetyltransferase [Burkholderiales bacterium]